MQIESICAVNALILNNININNSVLKIKQDENR